MNVFYVDSDAAVAASMLCVCCLEMRLGRKLQPKDFPNVTINSPKYEPKSQRLMNRMGY